MAIEEYSVTDKELGFTRERLLSPNEQQIFSANGITDSTNRVEIRVDPKSQHLILEKHIGRINAGHAANSEVEILDFLSTKDTKTVFSELALNRISTDEDGNPTIYIKMNPDYLPLAGDATFFDEIRRSKHPYKLSEAIGGIKEMHDLGIFHGVLHLNNIGVIPPASRRMNAQIMIIDFDLGKKDTYLTPDEIEDDLARFTSHILFNYPIKEHHIILDKILSTINSQYGDTIFPERLHDRVVESFKDIA